MANLHPIKRLCVFDFDDTLIHSNEDTQVIVEHKNGTKSSFTSKTWKEYKAQPGDQLDYSQFELVVNPQKVHNVWDLFINRVKFSMVNEVCILSARTSDVGIKNFLKEEKIDVGVTALKIPAGENNGLHKAKWIMNKMASRGESKYEEVEFFDDRDDCVQEVCKLRKKVSDTTKIHVWQVKDGLMHYLE